MDINVKELAKYRDTLEKKYIELDKKLTEADLSSPEMDKVEKDLNLVDKQIDLCDEIIFNIEKTPKLYEELLNNKEAYNDIVGE